MLFKNVIPALAGLVAVAQSVAIEPAVLDERQLICPAGYGPMGSPFIQTNVVVTNVVINQFFGSNTIINIFGNTFNINNAPTSISTTVTVTSTVTSTVTAGAAVATPFILGISAGGVAKRQGPAYIGAGGTQTGDCSTAAVFNLVNGQLSSGGLLVSTSPGTSFQPFAVSPAIGPISSTFSSTGNGLAWSNTAFLNGAAGFCLLGSTVEVTFNGTVPNCNAVVLSVIPANACPAISSSATSTPTSTPSTTSSTISIPSASITGAFNLQVQIPTPGKVKRQASQFIASGGVVTTDATQALSFFITAGQLFSSDGQYSTNVGTASEAFAPLGTLGTITNVFAASGPLQWLNGAFTNGAASFCLLGQTIQFVFTGSPAGCITVSLTPIPAGSAATTSASTTPGSTTPGTTSQQQTTPPPISSTPLPSSSSFGPFTTGNTTTTANPTGGLHRRY